MRSQLNAIWRDARPYLAPPWLHLPNLERLHPRVQENASPVYASPSPILQVYSLGEVSVRCNGRIIEDSQWHTTKNKHLFFCLLSHPHGISEDAILEEFWPHAWETGKQNLYSATSKLRHIFRSLSGSERRFIVRRQGRLIWEDNLPLWYDLHEVRRQAQDAHSVTALAANLRLVELTRGPFLTECEHNWAQTVRTEVELLTQNALAFLSRHYLEAGNNEEALELAQRLMTQYPLEQLGCELTMRALLNLGHSTRALACCRTFCDRLRHELDAAPTLELQKLYQQAKMGVTIPIHV